MFKNTFQSGFLSILCATRRHKDGHRPRVMLCAPSWHQSACCVWLASSLVKVGHLSNDD